jgi:hypothetical protein
MSMIKFLSCHCASVNTLSGKLVNSDLPFIPSPLRERVRVRVKKGFLVSPSLVFPTTDVPPAGL